MNCNLTAAQHNANAAPKWHQQRNSHYCGLRSLLVCMTMLLISACQTTTVTAPVNAPPAVTKTAPPPAPFSADPIRPAPKKTVRYAQTALKQLGYSIGEIDGLWGPRSARAIRAFEKDQKITSANGHLSPLNINRLEKAFGKTQDNYQRKPQGPKGIASKLDKSVPLTKSPQLIIVEREYQVFAKPNPYSATLSSLSPGTGIYVVSLQEGWYQIESINRLKGYVVAD